MDVCENGLIYLVSVMLAFAAVSILFLFSLSLPCFPASFVLINSIPHL